MRKNAVLPYALIAVVGIVLVIVISVAGNNQRATLEKEANGDNQTEEKSEGGETADPEDIFKQSCASCHANDLSGDFGPDLRKVGKDHSADDIKKIVLEGQGQMPAQDLSDDEATEIAEWLADHK
ncbi:MAG TPA: cytochrome c [Candidatus Avamphibacillus intestinigallinarum]|nr:cytochrome c [Candidatus Avamphibacillus intestinigallinarum]